jgi:hypothetical protein
MPQQESNLCTWFRKRLFTGLLSGCWLRYPRVYLGTRLLRFAHGLSGEGCYLRDCVKSVGAWLPERPPPASSTYRVSDTNQ